MRRAFGPWYLAEVPSYVIVDEFLPVLVARRIGPTSARGVTLLLESVEAHLTASFEKVAFVYDASDAPGGIPDAGARAFTGQWLRRQRRLLQSKCVGIDFAFGSPVSRGALTAVFWIAQPPVPWAIHTTTSDAIVMALERTGLTGRRQPGDILGAVTRAVRSAG